MSKTQRRAANAAARIMGDLSEVGSGTVILTPNGSITLVPSVKVIGTFNGDVTLDQLAKDIAATLDALEGGRR